MQNAITTETIVEPMIFKHKGLMQKHLMVTIMSIEHRYYKTTTHLLKIS